MQLNGSRKVIGILRGYDVCSLSPPMFVVLALARARLTRCQVFLNVVLDDAVEEKDGGQKVKLGMVVRRSSGLLVVGARLIRFFGASSQVIRGNSVVMMEALERIGGDDRRHQ